MPRHHSHQHNHKHHHRQRHDVYDDTASNQEVFDPSNEVTVHQREIDHPSRSRRRYDDHHESNAVMADPYNDMNSMMRAAERDMDNFFGRGFGGFGGGMFGSMRDVMTSMDRMFDDVAANARPGSGGTYYYKSSKRTVGPDGRVHEETVRTVPDAQGNPQTTRTIRDGDRVEKIGPYGNRIRNRYDNAHYDDDVVVEEVDEYDKPIRETRAPKKRSRDSRERHRHARDSPERHRDRRDQTMGGWLRNKYHSWRSGA